LLIRISFYFSWAIAAERDALFERMYSRSVGRKQPLFSESDLAELLKPLSK
jgi:hypothetical protein